jgi:hypothetical protein
VGLYKATVTANGSLGLYRAVTHSFWLLNLLLSWREEANNVFVLFNFYSAIARFSLSTSASPGNHFTDCSTLITHHLRLLQEAK